MAFGAFSPYLTLATDLTRREFAILLTLLIPTLALGLFPNIVLNDLHYSVSTLLYSLPLFLDSLINLTVLSIT